MGALCRLLIVVPWVQMAMERRNYCQSKNNDGDVAGGDEMGADDPTAHGTLEIKNGDVDWEC